MACGCFRLYDRKRLILEFCLVEGYLQSQAVVSENPSFVELASTYFESTWNNSTSNHSKLPRNQKVTKLGIVSHHFLVTQYPALLSY